MFKTNRSLLYIAFSWLTAYMGRSGLILYAGDIDLNAPEVKAAIDEAVAGLSSKNAELLKEVKELRKGKSVNPEDLDRIESERDDLKAQLDKASKDLKAATATAEKATKALADEQGFTQKLLIDNGLLETLSKNGVTDPAYQKAAVAMLRSGVQIVVDGENRVAKVGDKALADHVAEWAKSDEGKRFASAPGNSGGGAGGGSGQGNAKTYTRQQFDNMNPQDQANLSKAVNKGEAVLTD